MSDQPILIHLRETAGAARNGSVISARVPFLPGQCVSDTSWKIEIGGREVACSTKPLAQWPDGSASWLLIEFELDIDANALKTARLVKNFDDIPKLDCKIDVTEFPDEIRVTNNSNIWSVSRTSFGPAAPLEQCHAVGVVVTCEGSKACTVTVDSTTCEQQGELSVHIEQRGHAWLPGHTKRLNIRCRSIVESNSSIIRSQITVHNPAAASHKDGLWDLGDENSILLQELKVVLLADQGTTHLCIDDSHNFGTTEKSLTIYQESSGGDNWQSPNHRNAQGWVAMRTKGYAVFEGDEEIASGDRAQPQIIRTSQNTTIGVWYPKFWQEFPSALRATESTIEIAFLPREFPDCYELQPGESKTFDFNLDYRPVSVPSPILPAVEVTITPQVFQNCFWQTSEKNSVLAERLQALVAEGISGSENFFEKREMLDEYGWRNFGDVYGDHEAVDQEPGRFVTHYNNQYDLVYGFWRQFIETGDTRWQTLYSDLARHVIDIDLYRTELDRPEYNNGLFWHTDHYMDAGLATHRSFSREQPEHVYGDHVRGGGPASEHCYTRGIALYYFASGETDAKEACLRLYSWMNRVHEGPRTLLEWGLRCVKTYLPKIRDALRGQALASYSFPLTRGTGNYIRAQLDAFLITGESKYLSQIYQTIRRTAHPSDDLDARYFENVEATWSYTIFLTSVGEYLHIKSLLNEFDEHYLFARDTLLHYADWMLENEIPYLERPERLEFPNHTWTAQDIRKATVLYYAYRFSPVERRDFLSRATYFLTYVINSLEQEPTRVFTRIQAILLQNFDIAKAILLEDRPEWAQALPQSGISTEPPPKLMTLLTLMTTELWSTVRAFSIGAEYRWVKQRLGG